MVRQISVRASSLYYWSILAAGLAFMGYAIVHGWDEMTRWLWENVVLP